MIDEPGSFSGKAQLAQTRAAGREPRKRMSLAILNSAAATGVDGAVARTPWRRGRPAPPNLFGRGDEGQAGDRRRCARPPSRQSRPARSGRCRRRVPPCASCIRPGRVDLDPARCRCATCWRIAGEFLAERQGRGVLRVRAADLDDVRPGLLTLASSAMCRCSSAGSRRCCISSAQAMCMAVG